MIQTVAKTRTRTGWPVRRILGRLGLASGRYYAWLKRRELDLLDDAPSMPHHIDELLPEEILSIRRYALAHPQDGYRRLAWMMVDEDVAYVSASSVYKALKEADLLWRWKRPDGMRYKRVPPPERPHERWHTDLMYLWVNGRWYFLVSVLDGYSRFIVHWELLLSMRADETTAVVERAKAKHPGQSPEVVTDNGSQFTSREFRQLVKALAMKHIRIRTQHPESNGLIERYHRSLREGLSDKELADSYEAQDAITGWVAYYNEERLHASLHYLPPAEYLLGDPEQRIAERRRKLADGRAFRRSENRRRSEALAGSPEVPVWDAWAGPREVGSTAGAQIAHRPEKAKAGLLERRVQPLPSVSSGVAGRLPAGGQDTAILAPDARRFERPNTSQEKLPGCSKGS